MHPTSRAKLLTAATTVLILLVACNPDLLPLVPIVDAIGLDVLALLLGVQLAAAWPWLRTHAGGLVHLGGLAVGAVIAGFLGGYLRQLQIGLIQRTLVIRRSGAQLLSLF